jgi:hypothetical protein
MLKLSKSSVVIQCQKRLQLNELAKINSKLKTKQHGIDKVKDYLFNPNSSDHLKVLLFDIMDLPVLDTTPTKEPATGAGTIGKLINHTTIPEYVKKIQVEKYEYFLNKSGIPDYYHNISFDMYYGDADSEEVKKIKYYAKYCHEDRFKYVSLYLWGSQGCQKCVRIPVIWRCLKRISRKASRTLTKTVTNSTKKQ